MCTTRNRLPVVFWMILVLMFTTSVRVEGQLASPAADAAEALLEVVRAGDEDRLREFIKARFTPELRDMVPMEQHLRMFDYLWMDLRGREASGVELRGPTEVSLFFTGPEDRLEMRLRVDPEPPHRIAGLRVVEAGPEIRIGSLDELGPELEQLARRDAFSGVVLVADSGEILFYEGYGRADRETGRPNRPTTRFDIGSLNKLFTAAAALRLVQDGRLELSDPIGKFLDGFRPEVARKVTALHLLRHRSGFGDYLTHPEFEADPKRFMVPADFLPLAREQDLAFEPGTDHRYSNLGYVLLGAIIESVTDRGYHEVIEDLVFEPAGMATAGPAPGADAARRYHRMDEGFVAVDSLYPDVSTPAGGGFATAMDLHRFLAALLDYKLLKEENTTRLLNNFREDANGLPEEIVFSGGAAGVNAILRVRPAERHWVIILANIDTVAVDALARRVQRLSK